MPTLSAQATFDQVAKDKNFQSFSPDDKVLYLQQEILPKVDPTFQQLKPEDQKQYIQQEVLPHFQAPEVHQLPMAPQPGPVQTSHPNPIARGLNDLNKGLEAVHLAGGAFFDPAIDSYELGWTHNKEQNEALARKEFPGIEKDPGLLGQAYQLHHNGLVNLIGEGAGMVNPIRATEGLAAKALGNTVKNTLLKHAITQGLGFGGYEALHARPGKDQFDPLGRLQSGAIGAATGFALPYVGDAVGKVGNKLISGLVEKYAKPQLLSREAAIKAAQEAEALAQANRTKTPHVNYSPQLQRYDNRMAAWNLQMTPDDILQMAGNLALKVKHGVESNKAIQATATNLENLLQDIEAGTVEAPKKLTQFLERRLKAIKAGAARETQGTNAAIKAIRQQFTRKVETNGQEAIQGEITKTSPEPTAPTEGQSQGQEEVKLHASIEKQVKEQLGGHTLDYAKALLQKLATFRVGQSEELDILRGHLDKYPKGSRDSAAKELRAQIKEIETTRSAEKKQMQEEASRIHPNLRQVLGTEHDLSTGIGKQKASEDLTFDDVKDDIPKNLQGDAEKLDQALQNGNKIAVEHRAEITGKTGKAVTVTKGGNVKTARTDVSPISWFKTDKGVGVNVYNELGHESKYYLTETPEGSRIEAVGKEKGPAFVGTTARVGQEPGEYKIADILNRKDREEGILTSDVEKLYNQLAGLFKPEVFNSLSKPLRSILNSVRKQGRITPQEVEQIVKLLQKDKEQMEIFCQNLRLH